MNGVQCKNGHIQVLADVVDCCRFEEVTTALNQEPTNTEEMDALERYLGAVEQVGAVRGAYRHALLTILERPTHGVLCTT